jgi:glycosyltransferase involved in cell wall biosynthesis
VKIAIVLDAVHPYSTGGRETLYRHVVAGLRDEGHEVTVYTMQWWKGPARITTEGVRYQAIMRYVPLYAGKRRSVVHAVCFALACLRMVTFDYDVIEADHMPYLQLLPLRLVAFLRRVPLVVTWHELWGSAYWREYLGPLGIVAAAFERLSTMLPRLIIADSPETHERLIRNGVRPEMVITIAPGVEMEKIQSVPTVAGYDLLFAGRLISHKGVDMALEALSMLRSRGVSVTFGVVGVGPQSDDLERRAAELELTDTVTFVGNLEEQAALFSLMKGSRLFVLPSSREGFGLVVLEAAAAGLATITVNHPDNYARELVIEGVTGWVCEPTATALAEAIAVGLRTPLHVTKGAHAVLEGYRWETAAAKRVQAYRRAGARPGSTG